MIDKDKYESMSRTSEQTPPQNSSFESTSDFQNELGSAKKQGISKKKKNRRTVQNNPDGANQYRWDLKSGVMQVYTINPACPRLRTYARGWPVIQKQSEQKNHSTLLQRDESLSQPADDTLLQQNYSPELQLFCDDNGIPYGENSYEKINQAFETLLQQNPSPELQLFCDDNEVFHEENSNEPISRAPKGFSLFFWNSNPHTRGEAVFQEQSGQEHLSTTLQSDENLHLNPNESASVK